MLANFGIMAEKVIHQDINTCVIKIRQMGEYIASFMIKKDGLEDPISGSQLDRIRLLKREDLVTTDIEEIFHLIRKKGNKAVHPTYIGVKQDEFLGNTEDARVLLGLVLKLSAWFCEVYGNDHSFDSNNIIYKEYIEEDYKAKYEALEKQVKKQEDEFKNQKIDTNDLEKEQRNVRRKNARLKLTEEETREVIDYQLREAGWEVDSKCLDYKTNKVLPQKGKAMAIAEYPCLKDDGKTTGWADYALFIDRELVGIIEAKKYDIDIPTALRKDARMYSVGATLVEGAKLLKDSPFLSYKVPFMYSANGRDYNEVLPEKSGIWFLDGRKKVNEAKAVRGFHSPSDIGVMLKKDDMASNNKLQSEGMEYLQDSMGLGLRDYQVEAIKSVENALIGGSSTALLTMATGTGKTRTAIGLIYRLIKAQKYNRILFLVDRSALGNQTADSFKDNKIESMQTFGNIYDIKELKDTTPDDDTKLQIATIQGMVKRVLYSNDNKPSIGQYDCIVIDEAHRGYILDKGMTEEELEYKTQDEYLGKYRRVIEYFEADKVALTATPAKHTAEIFGKPVYSYSYRQAVLDGYLVDHEPPYIIKTKLMEDGISYGKGDTIQVYDTATQTLDTTVLNDELNFEVEHFNRKVVNESFTRVMCRELVKKIDPNGEGKTLIFAATDFHADMVVRILKEEYKREEFIINEDTISKQTGYVKDVNKEIKKFKLERDPNIVVTVDLLTTGIDVPTISNLVFMRKVKSRILYEQMVGRATRLCPSIDKDHFKIFDCVDLYSDLKDYTDMKAVVKSPKASFNDLTTSLVDNEDSFESIKGEIIAKMQRKKVNIKKHKKLRDLFKIESGRDIETFIDDIKNINSIDELVKEVKYINYLDDLKLGGSKYAISDSEDEVMEVSRTYGKATKPKDYLDDFKEWVNKADFDAIRILRESPEKIKKEDIKQIKLILDNEGYSEQNLKTAYTDMTNEDITADILNFVKNAMGKCDIIDFNEKVTATMKKIYKLHRWNAKQKQILGVIEKQLMANHIVTIEDINTGMLRSRYGGKQRVDKTLDHKLEEVLDIIKEEVVLY